MKSRAVALLFFLCSYSHGEEIAIDARTVVKTVSAPTLGINLNYLRDDEADFPNGRPILSALKDLRPRYLRYPGGEKSMEHRFAFPPYTSEKSRVLGWYTNATNGHAILSFEKFIHYARETGAEPFVVVPIAFGEEFEETKNHAAAWVRYANRVKNFGVRYWEIGNELWHKNKKLDPKERTLKVAEISRAMKAVDPGIRTGASGMDVTDKTSMQTLDFLTESGYRGWGETDFEPYRTNTASVVSEQVRSTIRVKKKSECELPLVIAEYGAVYGKQRPNDLGHALLIAEMALCQIESKDILFSMFWATRWLHSSNANEIAFYALDGRNELTASGRAIWIVGNYSREQILHGSMRPGFSWHGSLSLDGKALTLFLFNKTKSEMPLSLKIDAQTGFSKSEYETLSGNGLADRFPKWERRESPNVEGNRISLELRGESLGVLRLSP